MVVEQPQLFRKLPKPPPPPKKTDVLVSVIITKNCSSQLVIRLEIE